MGPSVGDFLEPWNVGFQHMCHGQKSRLLGMVIPPVMTESLFHGYINGIGLMSLSPIIWKCHGS